MSINKQRVLDVKAYIEENYFPEHNGQGYWKLNNDNDVFKLGEQSGTSHVLYHIGSLIGLDLPSELEMDYDE